jgi:hypothetical protein
MKSFLTAIAANLLTIAICVVGGLLLIIGIAASAGSKQPVTIADGAVLVIDLERAFSDRPAETKPGTFLDDALSAGAGDVMPLRAATLALKAAAEDDRISGILLRGSIPAGGNASGFAALRELRAALISFRQSKKPVHAYLVNPETRDYYVASTASVITIDPFGSLRRRGNPHPEARGSGRPHRSLYLQSRRRGWSQTPRSRRSDRRIPCEWWGYGALRACRHWGPVRRPRECLCECRRRSRRQVLGPCRPVPGLVMPSLLDGGGEGAIS